MKKFLMFLVGVITFLVATVVNIVLITIVYNVGVVPVLTELGCKPIDVSYGVVTMIWFIYMYLHNAFSSNKIDVKDKIDIKDEKGFAVAIGNIFGKMIGKSFIVLIIWILSIIIF